MTTVAWDGHTLAAESYGTRKASGFDHCGKCNTQLTETIRFVDKVHVTKDDLKHEGEKIVAWAAAGAGPLIEMTATGLKLGLDYKTIGKMAAKAFAEHRSINMTMILITEEHAYKITYIHPKCFVSEKITEDHYAVGSGSKAALLGMKRMGLSAMAAVACGIDVDPGSGGEVCYVQCRGKVEERVIQRYTYTEADIAELFK